MARQTRTPVRRGWFSWLLRALFVLVLSAFVGGWVVLHLAAASFESKATAVVEGLSQLRIGASSKHEALAKIPGLERSPRADHDGHEAYEIVIQNPVSYANLLHRIFQRTGTAGYEGAYLYGVRHWWFGARVEFRDGLVDDVAYGLRVSSSESGYPWHVFANAGSLHDFEGVPITAVSAASPEYRVTSYAKWPEKEITVAFTRDAPHDFVRHAFDLHLNCISEIRGCSTAAQLLPKATADREVILKSAGHQY